MTRQYPLPLPFDDKMDAADFLTTPSNREARKWIDQWPRWPGPCLILYGPAGSGKTHLLHVWCARSGATSVDGGTPLDDVLGRDAGKVAIDGADRVAGDADREESLFHLYNRIKDKSGSLLLTSITPPAQWALALPDLRSRLLAAPAAAIAPPDDELLAALLVKQFHDRQINVHGDVIDYILPRIERTPGAVRRLVNDLDHTSLAEGRRITIALARSILNDGESSAG